MREVWSGDSTRLHVLLARAHFRREQPLAVLDVGQFAPHARELLARCLERVARGGERARALGGAHLRPLELPLGGHLCLRLRLRLEMAA